MNILEIEDKTGRLIRLTKERWSHIRRDHPDVQEQEIETTLACPIRIIPEKLDKHFYYCYFKNKSSSAKSLRVIGYSQLFVISLENRISSNNLFLPKFNFIPAFSAGVFPPSC